MVAPSTPKVAPIKLKLSLGSKFTTTTPAPSPTPIAKPIIRLTNTKGKGKATESQEEQNDATITQSQGEKKKSKSKVASNASSNEQNNDISMDEGNQAGPSRTSLPKLSSPAYDQVTYDPLPEDTINVSSTSTTIPMTPTPTTRTKPSRGSTTKKSTAKSTPRTSKASTSKSKTKSKPSAIPLRLFSETVSTPSRSSIPLSETSHETPTSTITNHNNFDSSEATSPDPLSLPLSPSAYNGDSITVDTSQDQDYNGYDDTPNGGRGRTGGRWMRIKRPLKELLNRTLVEMRRKDDYALFEEPVDLEAFPDYLGVIGGEEKMMDMGTMQRKVDDGEYKNVEQLEVDLRLLVEAAQKFNPPGSIPYNSAGRILTVGLKHVERAKPLVLTPSPSPTRESATPFGRGYSVISGREGTIALEDSSRRVEEVPPISYIPEQMLEFPPNSLQALSVGWNLNGGKRIHAKRVVRSREKFNGKWRHWEYDGSRDLAEMDDVVSLLDQWRPTQGDELRKFVDWKNMRKHMIGDNQQSNGSGIWWESDTSTSGPTNIAGQPPTPFTSYHPRRDHILTREKMALEFGLYPEIDEEIKFIKKRIGINENESEILSEHLRPLRPRLKSNQNQNKPGSGTQPLLNIYENSYQLGRNSIDWLREISMGDTKGEAYLSSISKFVDGAMRGATKSGEEKEDQSESDRTCNDGEVIPLDEYVHNHYHSGLLSSSKSRSIIHEITTNLIKPTQDRPEYLKQLISNAYTKIALNELTSPQNPMDIKPLLRLENDFLHQGVGGKSGINGVKEGLKWIGGEIERLDRDLRDRLKREEWDKVEKLNLESERKGGDGKRKRDLEEENFMVNKKSKVELESNTSSTGTETPQPNPKAETSKPNLETTANSQSSHSKPSTNTQIQTPLGHISIPQPNDPGDTKELRQLRLELVALSKFYPLPALKKMRAFEALKLLPANVRGLMTVPEDLPKPQQNLGNGDGKITPGVKGKNGR